MRLLLSGCAGPLTRRLAPLARPGLAFLAPQSTAGPACEIELKIMRPDALAFRTPAIAGSDLPCWLARADRAVTGPGLRHADGVLGAGDCSG